MCENYQIFPPDYLPCLTSERLLQDPGELGVSVGHVGLAVGQSRDDVAQRRQRLVDVLRLVQHHALSARLAHLRADGGEANDERSQGLRDLIVSRY